jgi:hypothetical protein
MAVCTIAVAMGRVICSLGNNRVYPALRRFYEGLMELIRSLANDGTPERFTDGNRTVVMPTRAALHEFARNCGAEYIYVFEEEAWHCHKL